MRAVRYLIPIIALAACKLNHHKQEDEVNHQLDIILAQQGCAISKNGGIIKTKVMRAECLNQLFKDEMEATHYPYMDLVEATMKKRISLARLLDAKKITGAEAETQFSDLKNKLGVEAAQRNAVRAANKDHTIVERFQARPLLP